MLGKLFKYEFRATGRTFLPAYAVLLVMSLAARLLYSGTLAAHDAADGSVIYAHSTNTLTALVTIIMVMLFTAVWVVTLVVIIQRFWKNLLGREGYLTNVLPVAPWEHVCAKAVTSLVWVLLSALVSAAALLLMLGGVLGLVHVDWANLARDWADGWAYLSAEGAAGQGVLAIALAVLNGLFAVLCFVLMAYAAMCVGQLANKHRVWASIGAWFGFSIARSLFVSWLFTDRIWGGALWRLHWGNALTARELLSAVDTELLIYLLFTLAVCAVLFWLSQRLLKKRLNLQ